MLYWNKYRRQYAWKEEGAGGANNSAAKRRDDPSQAPGEWIATLWLSLFSFSLFFFVSFGYDFAFFVMVTCSPRKGKVTIQMLLWQRQRRNCPLAKKVKSNIKRKNLYFYFFRCASISWIDDVMTSLTENNGVTDRKQLGHWQKIVNFFRNSSNSSESSESSKASASVGRLSSYFFIVNRQIYRS